MKVKDYHEIEYEGKKYRIGITELNNKNRKGTYVYVKEKGKPNSYYKLEGGDYYDYIEIYKKSRKTRKGRAAKTRKLRKTLKKKGRISKKQRAYKSGKKKITRAERTVYTETTETITKADMLRLEEQLIGSIVGDEEITRIMLQPSNMEKLKHRLTTRITIENKNGEKIASMDDKELPHKRTDEIVNEIVKHKAVMWSPKKPEEVNIRSTAKNHGVSEGMREYKKIAREGEWTGKITIELILSK